MFATILAFVGSLFNLAIDVIHMIFKYMLITVLVAAVMMITFTVILIALLR